MHAIEQIQARVQELPYAQSLNVYPGQGPTPGQLMAPFAAEPQQAIDRMDTNYVTPYGQPGVTPTVQGDQSTVYGFQHTSNDQMTLALSGLGRASGALARSITIRGGLGAEVDPCAQWNAALASREPLRRALIAAQLSHTAVTWEAASVAMGGNEVAACFHAHVRQVAENANAQNPQALAALQQEFQPFLATLPPGDQWYMLSRAMLVIGAALAYGYDPGDMQHLREVGLGMQERSEWNQDYLANFAKADRPWYKNPLVWGAAAVGAVGIAVAVNR